MKADFVTEDIWNYLATAQQKKPIVLYGMGNGADKILKIFAEKGIKISGVFASDGFVRNKQFHGFKIKSYSETKQELGSFIVIVAFGSQLEPVIQNIVAISKEQELYAPDVSVYGNTVFNLNYYKTHRNEFLNLYNRLADTVSKTVLENIILFKLTGKINYLFNCQTPEPEAESLLNLSNNETFYDLGAYRGDTVLKFTNSVKNYKKIVAVEPDTKTFKKLTQNVGNFKNINLINACVGNTNGEALFNMSGDRNAHMGSGQTVPMVSIDFLAKTEKPTFIKMDIEGEELQAINGAEQVIKNYKPKMQIAAYHKAEDFLTLSKAVLSKNNAYKVYLRHFKYIPAWDINFYFV